MMLFRKICLNMGNIRKEIKYLMKSWIYIYPRLTINGVSGNKHIQKWRYIITYTENCNRCDPSKCLQSRSRSSHKLLNLRTWLHDWWTDASISNRSKYKSMLITIMPLTRQNNPKNGLKHPPVLSPYNIESA